MVKSSGSIWWNLSFGLETPRGRGVRAQHIAWCSSVPVAARCRTVVSGAGWAVSPPSLANFGGASDPPSSLICGVLVIPKHILWRGLFWFPAFRCWDMATVAGRLSWAESTMPRTYRLYPSYGTSLQRPIPACNKKHRNCFGGDPCTALLRLTARNHPPACLAVLATCPIPACNKKHRNYFGGDPPRFFISTYFKKPPTCLPSGPCHAKPNNHRRCYKLMAFSQIRCILLVAKQTKTKWNLPSAAWPTQHKMFSIQSPKPHLANSLVAKHIVRLPLHAHSLCFCRNLLHNRKIWHQHAHLYGTRSMPSRCRLVW